MDIKESHFWYTLVSSFTIEYEDHVILGEFNLIVLHVVLF